MFSSKCKKNNLIFLKAREVAQFGSQKQPHSSFTLQGTPQAPSRGMRLGRAMKAELSCREAAKPAISTGAALQGAAKPAISSVPLPMQGAELGQLMPSVRATPTPLTAHPQRPHPKKRTNLAIHIPRI